MRDRELTVDNTSVSIGGVGVPDADTGKKRPEPFQAYDGQDVKAWIDSVADDKEGAGEDDGPAEAEGGAEMEVDD